jgi:hypothetical protein
VAVAAAEHPETIVKVALTRNENLDHSVDLMQMLN